MDELIIGKKDHKSARMYRWVAGAFFTGYYLYMLINEIIIKSYGISFFIYAIGLCLGAILLFMNLFYAKNQMLKISNSEVNMNLDTQKFMFEWTSVSTVSVGINYIIFALNGGQKQQRLDLSNFTYTDLKNVKSKVFEICEQKNIAYKND